MRRYARTIAVIGVLVVLAVLILSFNVVKVGNFERGSEDTVLGLKLGLDLQGGSDLVYRAIDRETGEPVVPTADEMAALKRSIERRVNASGLGEPNIQLLGDNRLLIQLPGIRDLDRAKELIGETAQLVFKRRQLNVSRELPGVAAEDVLEIELTTMERLAGQLAATTTQPRSPETEAAITEALEEAERAAQETATTTDATPGPTTSTAATSTDVALPESSATTTGGILPAGGVTTTQTTGVVLPVAETSAATTTSVVHGFDLENETGTPALVLHLEDGAADEFQAALDRMRDSMNPVEGTGRFYPNSLQLATTGGTASPLSLFYYPTFTAPDGGLIPLLDIEPLIRRIGDGNRFALNVSLSFNDFNEAFERFATTTGVSFGEILGKVDEDVPGGLTGEDLARAYPGQHHASNLPIINIEFNAEGTEKFARVTSDIATAGGQDLLAIILDDEELISPTVRQAITGGVALIEGRDFTFDRVRDISLLLESGRLPVPIELIQERDVDAILGADSLAQSVRAGLVGLGLVLLFMVLYYRVPGLVAALALLIYAGLLLAIFKVLPVTLTLSGVAAAILSVGMAVDANILIFERMKEELRAGRTLLSAINIGFNRAWPAIRDSNVSTLITCVILFWFSDQLGATVVQGFAITLAIGVGVSMFSAITISRTFLRLAALTPAGKRLDLFVPAGEADLPGRLPTAEAAAGA